MKRIILILLILLFAITIFSAPGIYLNRAKIMKKESVMMRIYYMYSNMEQKMPTFTNNNNINTGVLFFSYGLTNNITLGTNLFYTHKTLENSTSTTNSSSNGMDDIVTLIKIALIKQNNMNLSGAFSIKWNSAFYVSANTTPTIGTNSTDIITKILYDKKIGDIWITLIPSYSFIMKDNSNYDHEIRFIFTSSVPLYKKSLYGEFDFDMDYTFNSDTNTDAELFIKGLVGFQYKLNKSMFYQILLGYGQNSEDSKTFKMLRTGFSINY